MTEPHPSLEPPHPGELMLDVIEHLSVGKAETARRLGVVRTALYNVLDERSAVTADMAVRFERVTGTSAGLLVRMQAEHDLWKERRMAAK